MRYNDRFLVVSAYLLGVPAIYITLSGSRYQADISEQAGKALVMWVKFFVVFFCLRLLINLVWLKFYLPGLVWLETFAVLIMGIMAIKTCFEATNEK